MDTSPKDHLYVGIDVGGTKIQASLVLEEGIIVGSEREPTPRSGGAKKVLQAIEDAFEHLMVQYDVSAEQVLALGVAIPGVVDPKKGKVIITPNMNLSNVDLVLHLERKLNIPVALGNDCNLGTLGEYWLGAARKYESSLGVLVGTGIGGGFVRKGKIWQGARECALEIGHMIMEVDGPVCGCGSKGCFETLASRTAIERKIREAVEQGESTVLTEILDGDLSLIRSGALKQALSQNDPVVSRVIRECARVLGYGCLTLRHVLDPQAFVLGGGVLEACGEFIYPIVKEIIDSDPLKGANDTTEVLMSALGDDAVVLGAVALARQKVKRSPFKKRFASSVRHLDIQYDDEGFLTDGIKDFHKDIYIRVNGKIKELSKAKPKKKKHNRCVSLTPKDLRKICQGGPQFFFLGTGDSEGVELPEEAMQFLDRRSIECVIEPTADAVESYNACHARKAAMFFLS